MSSSVPPPGPPSPAPPGPVSESAQTEADGVPDPSASTAGGDQGQWPVWTAPAAVAMGFAIGVFVSVIVGAIGSANGSSLTHPTPAISLISDALFDLAFVGSAIFFASVRGRPHPADFGFRRVRLSTALAALVVTAIGYYVISAIYASVLKLHGSDKLPSELGVSKSTAALVGATVFVCVVAPVAEEFFFRGFIFGALRRMRIVVAGRDLGTWVAAALTGILFGLAHTGSASSQYLVPLGFLGFVLCLLRWRTGSLYPCIALHSINNSLALGISQLHWNTVEILGLMAGSLLVIGAATAPLAGRTAAFGGLGHAR